MNRYAIEEKKKKKKKHKIAKTVIMIFILALVAVSVFIAYRTNKLGGGWRGFLAAIMGHNENTVNELGTMYCLILGESEEMTDTIMLVSYNPAKQAASVVSVPRDTFIGENKNRPKASDKINYLYRGNQNQKKDAMRTVRKVEEITGLNIPYYVVIDTAGIRKLVDLLGGVYFDVPKDMEYDDYSQDLHINLKKGYQLLDGDKAEQVLRYRHSNDRSTYHWEYGTEDHGRMKTQQAFIMALLEQTLKAQNITKIYSIIDLMYENLNTNIKIKNVKDYVPYALEFKAENLKMATLPGEDTNKNATGVWITVLDEEEIALLVEELFLINIEQEKDNAANEDTKMKADLKIEILNGSGKTNLLSTLNTKLKDKGYNIVKATKTTSTTKTTIINRTKVSKTLMDELKKAVGTGTVTTGDEDDNIDITIIIGSDYN